MAFEHCIPCSTNLTANLDQFRITPDIDSKLLHAAIWNCCAVWLNLSRLSFFGQVTFHLRPILLQTLVAINSEPCQTLSQSFCAPQSEVAVLFDSNLSRCPFLGHVIDLDPLLCTGFDLEHAVLFLCHIFTQRPMICLDSYWRKGCVPWIFQ